MIKLNEEEAAEVLDWLNAGKGLMFARQTVAGLTRMGYALVAVSGPALEQARGDQAKLPPATPDQAERIERWCAPERIN